MRGTWRVLIAETLTGRVLDEAQPRDLPSFTRKITDKGSWTVNVIPHDRHNQHLDLQAYTDVGRISWIILYESVIVQAGPVATFQYDENTSTLSISGTGIQGLFDRRVVRNPQGKPGTPISDVSHDLTYKKQTLPTIARNLVGDNMKLDGYALPITLPDPVAGENERTYQGYDLAMVWDRLDELSKVINGPELDFEPRFVEPNTIGWSMVIGTPKLGSQTTPAVWDYGAGLTQIDVDINGSASPCMNVWTKGSGHERELVVGYYSDPTLTALGFPPTDYVDSEHTSATKVDTLNKHAQAAQERFAAPVEKWSCGVRIDRENNSPGLEEWNLGDAPQFGVTGHPWIPDGMYRRRVLGYQNSSESIVTLELDTTLEVI